LTAGPRWPILTGMSASSFRIRPRPLVLLSILCLGLGCSPWIAGTVVAQTGRAVDLPASMSRSERLLVFGEQGEDLEPPAPLETVIDPTKYRLFAGDQLHLGIWGEVPFTHIGLIQPEGDLMVPRFGPVRLQGLTLLEGEEAVRRALVRQYPNTRITLRLKRPAEFRVSVTGMVKRPGIYVLTGVDRLSAALVAAGGLRSGASIRLVRIGSAGVEETALIDTTSRSAAWASTNPGGPRSGPATHSSAPAAAGPPADGVTETYVDLLPWLLSGDTSANPFLEPGMRIDVPPQAEQVKVRGAVNGRPALEGAPAEPGAGSLDEAALLVEFREGDTIGDALAQAGGLSDRASGTGLLRREGGSPEMINLRDHAVLARSLRAGDELEVATSARWVFVTGAVRAPGRFPYLPGLSAVDYVYLAGGPSDLGRSSGWKLTLPGGESVDAQTEGTVLPGSMVRVPNRRSYLLGSVLGPVSSAVALIVSLVAISR